MLELEFGVTNEIPTILRDFVCVCVCFKLESLPKIIDTKLQFSNIELDVCLVLLVEMPKHQFFFLSIQKPVANLQNNT